MLIPSTYIYTREFVVHRISYCRTSVNSSWLISFSLLEGLPYSYRSIMCTSCCNGIVYADSCCQVNPNTARPNDDYCQLVTGKKIRKACLCKYGKVLLNEPYKSDGSHSGNHSHTWTQEVICFLGVPERFPTFESHYFSRKTQNSTAMSKVSDHLHT